MMNRKYRFTKIVVLAFSALLFLGCGKIVNNSSGERSYIITYLRGLHEIERVCKSNRYKDEDNDGIGEYLNFEEMRNYGLPSSYLHSVPYNKDSFSTSGYHIFLVVPNTDLHDGKSIDLRESHWWCYAHRIHPDRSNKWSFLIDETGQIYFKECKNIRHIEGNSGVDIIITENQFIKNITWQKWIG